jgi:hypothetical protein
MQNYGSGRPITVIKDPKNIEHFPENSCIFDKIKRICIFLTYPEGSVFLFQNYRSGSMRPIYYGFITGSGTLAWLRQ